jgi:SP family sugar:H+ symporter-like MFS transporter
VIVSLFLVNRIGRRKLLISTGIFMTFTDVVIGAIGIKHDRTDSENTAIVAMIMLYVFAFNLGMWNERSVASIHKADEAKCL